MTKVRIYIDEVGNADLGSSADPNHLIAHPSFKHCLRLITGHDTLKPLGQRIAEILVREKYYRSNDGTINGWGIKWLP